MPIAAPLTESAVHAPSWWGSASCVSNLLHPDLSQRLPASSYARLASTQRGMKAFHAGNRPAGRNSNARSIGIRSRWV